MNPSVEALKSHWIKSFSDDPKAITSFSSHTAPARNIMWWGKKEISGFCGLKPEGKSFLITSSAGQNGIKNLRQSQANNYPEGERQVTEDPSKLHRASTAQSRRFLMWWSFSWLFVTSIPLFDGFWGKEKDQFWQRNLYPAVEFSKLWQIIWTLCRNEKEVRKHKQPSGLCCIWDAGRIKPG